MTETVEMSIDQAFRYKQMIVERDQHAAHAKTLLAEVNTLRSALGLAPRSA